MEKQYTITELLEFANIDFDKFKIAIDEFVKNNSKYNSLDEIAVEKAKPDIKSEVVDIAKSIFKK